MNHMILVRKEIFVRKIYTVKMSNDRRLVNIKNNNLLCSKFAKIWEWKLTQSNRNFGFGLDLSRQIQENFSRQIQFSRQIHLSRQIQENPSFEKSKIQSKKILKNPSWIMDTNPRRSSAHNILNVHSRNRKINRWREPVISRLQAFSIINPILVFKQ